MIFATMRVADGVSDVLEVASGDDAAESSTPEEAVGSVHSSILFMPGVFSKRAESLRT
jgi:hypothetical protein